MAALADLAAALIALLHLAFLVLEMFLWTKPLGLKTFRNTPEKAELTKALPGAVALALRLASG